jgi:hypothetical protein
LVVVEVDEDGGRRVIEDEASGGALRTGKTGLCAICQCTTGRGWGWATRAGAGGGTTLGVGELGQERARGGVGGGAEVAGFPTVIAGRARGAGGGRITMTPSIYPCSRGRKGAVGGHGSRSNVEGRAQHVGRKGDVGGGRARHVGSGEGRAPLVGDSAAFGGGRAALVGGRARHVGSREGRRAWRDRRGHCDAWWTPSLFP